MEAHMILGRRSFLATLPALLFSGCRGKPRVVLYCAQDREFAEAILDDFSREHGIDAVPKFDSEANKSVSLYEEIVAEKGHPRCDVFWNNEILGTIRLQSQELLQPYDSPSASPYPSWAKAKDHTWYAFASRARILIVNTKLVAEKDRPSKLTDLTKPRWRGKLVMAKPQFGTTATHAACLFAALGDERAKAFYRELKSNDIHFAPGNKQVAEWVAQGRTPTGQPAAVGMTDTDDAIDEVKAGRAVAIIFPDRDADPASPWGTLFIPNTLCIPRGCPNLAAARKLVDYLLSADVEKRLAEGPSAQLPLNPQVKAKLPPQIETPATVKAMAMDWGKAAEKMDDARAFLTKEITAP
jgi:iron(III) transport system substrate-binding protein